MGLLSSVCLPQYSHLLMPLSPVSSLPLGSILLFPSPDARLWFSLAAFPNGGGAQHGVREVHTAHLNKTSSGGLVSQSEVGSLTQTQTHTHVHMHTNQANTGIEDPLSTHMLNMAPLSWCIAHADTRTLIEAHWSCRCEWSRPHGHSGVW